jgi:hypothetical protein
MLLELPALDPVKQQCSSSALVLNDCTMNPTGSEDEKLDQGEQCAAVYLCNSMNGLNALFPSYLAVLSGLLLITLDRLSLYLPR